MAPWRTVGDPVATTQRLRAVPVGGFAATSRAVMGPIKGGIASVTFQIQGNSFPLSPHGSGLWWEQSGSSAKVAVTCDADPWYLYECFCLKSPLTCNADPWYQNRVITWNPPLRLRIINGMVGDDTWSISKGKGLLNFLALRPF